MKRTPTDCNSHRTFMITQRSERDEGWSDSRTIVRLAELMEVSFIRMALGTATWTMNEFGS